MKAKILIVDDDKTIRELASLVVEIGGYQVFTAEDGPSALKIVKEQQPSLVLLDYRMPGMNGLEVLQKIKRCCPDIYVMIFTGQGNEELAVEFMKAGASDYLLKPFSNKFLLRRIEQALKMRETEMNNLQLVKEKNILASEIEEWNMELEQRVNEKSMQLESARVELAKAEKFTAIGHLSAALVHDIKNPLNAISLYCELLKSIKNDGAESDDEFTLYTENILTETDRIDQILLKLLGQTTAEAADNTTEKSTVCIHTITKEVIDLLAIQVESKNIKLDYSFSPLLQSIEFNKLELGQILSNLLTNAINAVVPGGEIQLTTDYIDDTLFISVTDNGCGIQSTDLDNIFTPFFTTKGKGSGLGLPTVERLVSLHGGNIEISSMPNKGTTFNITIPIMCIGN